jgi:protein-tyrosine phosphatase
LIDLHSHVLPGLDDGAADLEGALAICAAVAADGVEVLAATPHVRSDYPTTPEAMEDALALVNAAGPPVTVVAGGELDLGELDAPLELLARFGLGGSTTLLIETPYTAWPLDLGDKLFRLHAQGFRTMLAHPERNPDVQERPALLQPVVAAGTLVQVTAASVDGRLGQRPRACARTLLDGGLVHVLASDAHAPEVRAAGIGAAAAKLDDDDLARWLTVDVPRAILEDRELPPRPGNRPRRRLLFARRR